jgi:alpha-L-fucosidase 2
VQELFDEPYNKEAAPSKIPGAAFEFYPQKDWGEITSSSVDIFKALAVVNWSSGVRMQSFVSSTTPYGFFRIQNAKKMPDMRLIPPAYEGGSKNGGEAVVNNDLSRLGYKQGKVDSSYNGYSYLQEGHGGFKYRVTIFVNRLKGGTMEGIWYIASGNIDKASFSKDTIAMKAALRQGFDIQLTQHVVWWGNFWKKSEVQVPDKAIQRQYMLTQYFLGSTSRKGNPPISLQAIWTADNGRLPPWKGDFHHDLNTQMSYWPAYTANHLEESMVFPDYLDARKDIYKSYTQRFFGKEGLNVPGVTTLAGNEMGGWIQYAFSPTVSAWLSQHYYWQWRYSMDNEFLKLRAYPWVKETAKFLEQLSVNDANGKRKLPLSSSPEINDNRKEAWFTETTNHDLALMKFTWKTAASMAGALGLENDAAHWASLYESLPEYALSPNLEMKFAPTLPYNQSHRHFSHLMAIYPLGLINWEDGDSSRQIIKNSLHLLDSMGSSKWNGYSYSWQAALKARARDGAGAEKALQIFAEAFCSGNGFHLNGDVTKKHTSNAGRPFTLEGNFGFAAGLQEMLIQSHTDTVLIMPAIPQNWQNVSFSNLRVQGGFLVSAVRENGKVRQVKVTADADGFFYIKIPYPNYSNRVVPVVGKPTKKSVVNGVVRLYLTKGSEIEINPTKWPY